MMMGLLKRIRFFEIHVCYTILHAYMSIFPLFNECGQTTNTCEMLQNAFYISENS